MALIFKHFMLTFGIGISSFISVFMLFNPAIMYIVREIFRLKFGHYKDAKALVDEAVSKKMLPETKHSRLLSDFTGPSYRLIMESGFATLGEFETTLTAEMGAGNWSEWYHRFKQHVESSEREILKVV